MTVPSHTLRLVALALTAGILSLCTGGAATAPAALPAAGAPQGPQFYSGAVVDVSGTVDGDVYAVGQSVTISGDVTGDVIAAAQTITITGTVDGNLRLAGQAVTISGDVSRSGTILAADVIVAGAGSFGGDLVGAANNVRIAGKVGRNLQVSVGKLTIDGSVGGTVTYSSNSKARIAQGAVSGNVERVEPSQSPQVEVSPWAVFLGWFVGLLYALVALSLITVLAGLLLPRLLQRVTDQLVPSPWRALLVGFVAAIIVPVALLFLLVTIVGAPVALAGMLVWSTLTLATFVYVAYYLGRLILRGPHHPVVASVVGGLILITALQIPWLNIVVWFAMVFFGLGAQLLEFHRQRPWRIEPDSDAARQGLPATPVTLTEPPSSSA